MDEVGIRRMWWVCVGVLCLAGSAGLVVADGWRSDAIFFEDFEDADAVSARWVHSTADDKYSTKMQVDLIDQDVYGLNEHGFNMPHKARHYGVAAESVLENPSDGLVVQFEVRSREGMDCGGAYLKLIAGGQGREGKLEEFSNETPYSIMFGPDRCGTSAKTHFIIQLPDKDGELVEHHMLAPPPPHDKANKTDTQLYRAVVWGDGKVTVTSPQAERTVELMSEKLWAPPVQPPEEIPDPEDVKPEDWVDAAKIPDETATKPDDWDENAPAMIPDEDAVKPEGWLDDEKTEIPDPDAAKPDEWDDDEDGEWEAPVVPNPKCQEAPGCGEWVRPMKPNAEYKGKWSAPLIDNPAYKGEWKAKDIPNPKYVKVEKAELLPIRATGIEIWTMDSGVVFDNILIARDVKTADAAREELYEKKRAAERKRDQAEDEKEADQAAADFDKAVEEDEKKDAKEEL